MTNKSAIAMNTVLLSLLCAVPTLCASAQKASESPKAVVGDSSAEKTNSAASARPDPNSWPVHTFYLKNSDGVAMLNDDANILRNMVQSYGTVVYPLDSQNAIVVRANPSDIPKIETILSDIDHPIKTYRVTYTITEMDNDKRIGTQHFAMIMVSGQQTTLKQGSKVPTATLFANAVNAAGAAQASEQMVVTYLDIGMNFDAKLQDMGVDGRLKYEIRQSSLAPETSGVGPQDPIVRQTSLQGEATLAPGKPLMLGSIDIPGSTRRLDVEVLMEPLP